MFLTTDHLRELTGLQRPSSVRRWLDEQHIPYLVGADGWPRVLQAVILERMSGVIVPNLSEPRLRLRNG